MIAQVESKACNQQDYQSITQWRIDHDGYYEEDIHGAFE